MSLPAPVLFLYPKSQRTNFTLQNVEYSQTAGFTRQPAYLTSDANSGRAIFTGQNFSLSTGFTFLFLVGIADPTNAGILFEMTTVTTLPFVRLALQSGTEIVFGSSISNPTFTAEPVTTITAGETTLISLRFISGRLEVWKNNTLAYITTASFTDLNGARVVLGNTAGASLASPLTAAYSGVEFYNTALTDAQFETARRRLLFYGDTGKVTRSAGQFLWFPFHDTDPVVNNMLGTEQVFPHVGLTQNTGVYNASASTEHISGLFHASRAFDKVRTGFNPDFWHSADSFNTLTGIHNTGINGPGEWLQIQLPFSIVLKRYEIYPRTETTTFAQRSPNTFTIQGSSTGLAGSWTVIDTETEIADWTKAKKVFNIPGNTQAFSYYRIVITKVGNSDQSTNRNSVQIAEWELFGAEINGTISGSASIQANSGIRKEPALAVTGGSGTVSLSQRIFQSPLTVALWLKTTQFILYHTLLIGEPTHSPLIISNGRVGGYFTADSFSNRQISPNRWFHIVMTANESAYQYYVNGVLWHSTTSTNPFSLTAFVTNISRTGPALALGSQSTPASFQDIRMWNRVLTQAEIKQVMLEEVTWLAEPRLKYLMGS
jgi:hypothetical protein